MDLEEQTAEAEAAAMHVSSHFHWSDLRLLLCRDEENPYLAAKAPMAGGPPTMGQRFWKELRQNWWLWGSVVLCNPPCGRPPAVQEPAVWTALLTACPFLAGMSLSTRRSRTQVGCHLKQHPF